MSPRHGQRFVIALIAILAGVALALWLADRGDGSGAVDATQAAGLSANTAPDSYWTGEFRRRWLAERRDGRARAATIRALRRILREDGHVVEAVNLACATYQVDCQMLWRKASCETGGTFSREAYNRSSGASGLFQFLPSTFRSTPYGRFSIWSPYANAMAAAWMHANGRGNEWACR
jgi:hypothetical protein